MMYKIYGEGEKKLKKYESLFKIYITNLNLFFDYLSNC